VTRAKAVKGLMLPGALSLLALAVLISLGNWQMQRLAWKEDLIARASERAKLPPAHLPGPDRWSEAHWRQAEYRTFAAAGRFRHDYEVQVYTVLSDAKGTYSGAGYWVLTPLELADKSYVIVNRGFVPLDRKSPATRKDGQIEGETSVLGLLRAPEETNYFTPANDPAKGAWYSRKPEEIARAFNLKNVAPFLLDATVSFQAGQLPQPNETKLTFTNNHLGYALTWYGLACTLAGVFFVFARQRLRAGG
jgi:surfeit locus 1 family protein